MQLSTPLNLLYRAAVFSLVLQFRIFLSLVFYLIRICLEFVACRANPELRRMLSSNHCLGSDGKLLIAHNQILSFKIRGLMSIQDFKKQFRVKCLLKLDKKTNSLNFPELQEQIEVFWGYPFWKRCLKNNTFNIDNHISGGEVFEELGRLDEDSCAKIKQMLIRREFKRSEGSPWKIYLLHENGTKITQLLFIFHQSLGSGQTMYDLLMGLSSQNLALAKSEMKRVSSWRFAVRELIPPRNPLLFPLRLLRNGTRCSVPPSFSVPLEKLISQDHRFIVSSSTIKKNAVNQLSQRSSVPFVGVILSAITGGLRNYLEDEEVDFPPFVLCTLQDGDHYQRTRLLTSTRNVEITLPFGQEDAKDRLYDCKQFLIECQASSSLLMDRLDLFMEKTYPLSWKPLAVSKSPIILSSISGPESSESILNEEHEILDMDFTWNGIKYASVIFTTMTYCDKLRVVLSADPNAFQFEKEMDLSSILEYIEAEIIYMQKYRYKRRPLQRIPSFMG